jgi:hypothetical protein
LFLKLEFNQAWRSINFCNLSSDRKPLRAKKTLKIVQMKRLLSANPQIDGIVSACLLLLLLLLNG